MIQVSNHPDSRGDAFPVPDEAIRFIGEIREMHWVTINPGMTRGNHIHHGKREVLLVVHSDQWQFALKGGGTGETRFESVAGEGAEFVCIEAGVAHAVRNTGKEILRLLSFSGAAYDTENPDTTRVDDLFAGR